MTSLSPSSPFPPPPPPPPFPNLKLPLTLLRHPLSIDGVLLRSSAPLPGATRTLQYLQSQRVPFLLLTNGGGKPEAARVAELSRRLGVPLDPALFVQSHTPFADLVPRTEDESEASMDDACVLVTGGHGERCRRVAEGYGFRNVITPADILAAYPTVWPFAPAFAGPPTARPLPLPSHNHHHPSILRVSLILILSDPRDWALDTQLILDLLLSQHGRLGTLSPLNGDPALPNRGYQQDGQPKLFFSNSDLLWAAAWPLPRLGQGAFQAALRGVWDKVTGGAELRCGVYGKPHGVAFGFAEGRLEKWRAGMGVGGKGVGEGRGRLRRVYMVGGMCFSLSFSSFFFSCGEAPLRAGRARWGAVRCGVVHRAVCGGGADSLAADNPASDIQGANDYRSPRGTEWRSILVRSGVYDGTKPPAVVPNVVVEGVWDAVRWGLEQEGWEAEGGEGWRGNRGGGEADLGVRGGGEV
ncbi:hypothetical protein MMC34_002591 [Xylographa carneopallida]|nr:hypothetical protein [Xylographa carneopallida]